MKSLVVFYSRTGNTRKVALEIAGSLKSDRGEIADTVDRSGPIGLMKSCIQALRKKTVVIEPVNGPAGYDLILVGTPVWAGNMAPAVRTYLSEKRSEFGSVGRVAFFASCKGKDPKEKMFREMSEICGKESSGNLSVTAEEIDEGKLGSRVRDFLKKLKA